MYFYGDIFCVVSTQMTILVYVTVCYRESSQIKITSLTTAFIASFHHIRTKLQTGGPSAGPGSTKDGAGRDAARDSGSDIAVIPDYWGKNTVRARGVFLQRELNRIVCLSCLSGDTKPN